MRVQQGFPASAGVPSPHKTTEFLATFPWCILIRVCIMTKRKMGGRKGEVGGERELAAPNRPSHNYICTITAISMATR